MSELGIAAVLLVVGFFVGGARERKHFSDLKRREAILVEAVLVRSDFDVASTGESFLVIGSVVVASDYFKDFVGGLRNFFGGRLTSHESLLDRARRESMCRMREAAMRQGASEVVGVRMETTRIAGKGVEALSYGTAIRL